MPYREEQGQNLTLAELQDDLQRFSHPDERQWVQEDDAAFYWHLLYNLRRNCQQWEVDVPSWLESLLDAAPLEVEAQPILIT